MKNFVQPGDMLDLVAPSGGVTAGVGVIIGAIFAVPSVTVDEDEEFAGAIRGVFDLDATTHASTQAGVLGDPVYFVTGTGKTSQIATGNTLIGVLAADRASTDEVSRVLLTPRMAEPGDAIADLALTAVTGVNGTGNNSASKADVDTAFTAINAKVNAIIAAMEAAGVIKA